MMSVVMSATMSASISGATRRLLASCCCLLLLKALPSLLFELIVDTLCASAVVFTELSFGKGFLRQNYAASGTQHGVLRIDRDHCQVTGMIL